MCKNERYLTLAGLKSETGISDATISRLRGEREPVKKYNISLLSNETNKTGIKIVTNYDLKLLLIYIIYSHIPNREGRPKQMKTVIEELNNGFLNYEYEDVIQKIIILFQDRIKSLNKLKNNNIDEKTLIKLIYDIKNNIKLY